jgi:hypothetical protein
MGRDPYRLSESIISKSSFAIAGSIVAIGIPHPLMSSSQRVGNSSGFWSSGRIQTSLETVIHARR